MYDPGIHLWPKDERNNRRWKNNWVPRPVWELRELIRGVGMRMEGGVRESFRKKLDKSRLELAGDVRRTGGEKMTKTTDAENAEG